MDFRILGPLEVADGDSVVTLPGAKQRALLAAAVSPKLHSPAAGLLAECGTTPEQVRDHLTRMILEQALELGPIASRTAPCSRESGCEASDATPRPSLSAPRVSVRYSALTSPAARSCTT